MKKPTMPQLCIIFLLALPLANAAAIAIDAPPYIIQGESINVNFSVNSSPSFSGTVYLIYTNINSSTSSAAFTSSSFAGDFYNYSWSIKGISPGAYSIFANVTNSSGETLATLNRTGAVNTSVPSVISASPSGIVNKESTILVIKTNEVATCRYGSTNNSYENLSNVFSNTGSSNHNESLGGLSQGQHTYYVRCEDTSGYRMNESAIIRFTVDLPPSAQIALSDSTPVKEGTIAITLTASESLDNAPALEYSFNDAPTAKKQISLTGSGSSWNGYLIITELDNDKIGTFYFTATDNVGNSGTKITSGNIFVVDTKEPSAPQSVKATSNTDGSIKINWYYAGEEADYFKIYRSTSPGIEYVDFYDESDETNGSQQFTDTAAIDKVTYYYRISTVDKSGNEGPLSGEVFATSVISGLAPSNSPNTAAESESQDAPKVLPPNLVPRVDIYIKKIDSLLIDAKDASSKLGEKEGEKAELIKELKLIEQANAAKSKLESLKAQLEGFKSNYATGEELEQKLGAVDLEAKKIERTTPKDAAIMEKSEFLQSTSKEDIEKAANELFRDISFTDGEKNEYVRKNEREKDKISVNVAAKVVSIEFLDGTKEEKTIVKKKLSYQGQAALNDVLVIETIPKAMASSLNEVEFSNQKFEVLREDAVKFGFLKFSPDGEEISYTLRKRINIDDVKNTKAVLLLSLGEITKSSSKVTGLSVFSLDKLGLTKKQATFAYAGILAIIGLAAYYLLFVKDYKYAFKKLYRAVKIRRAEHLNSQGPALPDLPDKNSLADTVQSDDDAKILLHELSLHIKDIKADLADNLLPLFVTLNNKLGSRGFNSKEGHHNNAVFVNALIDHAHQCLDNKLHAEAIKLYPKISFIYQTLPKESRAEIYPRCAHLRNRIENLKPIF